MMYRIPNQQPRFQISGAVYGAGEVQCRCLLVAPSGNGGDIIEEKCTSWNEMSMTDKTLTERRKYCALEQRLQISIFLQLG